MYRPTSYGAYLPSKRHFIIYPFPTCPLGFRLWYTVATLALYFSKSKSPEEQRSYIPFSISYDKSLAQSTPSNALRSNSMDRSRTFFTILILSSMDKLRFLRCFTFFDTQKHGEEKLKCRFWISTNTMSLPAIVNFVDIDFNKFSFTKGKDKKMGFTTVNILYDNRVPYFKFPKMSAVFGVSKWENKNKPGSYTYSLSTSWDNKNPDSSIKNVYNKAIEFDNFIKNKAIENYKEWLGESEEPDMKYIEKIYTPLVILPRDKTGGELDYSSRSNVSLSLNPDGMFSFSLYNEDKEKIDLSEDNYEEHIFKGDLIATMRVPRWIWISRLGFGVNWRLYQARVFSNKAVTSCVLSDSEDDTETATQTKTTEPKYEVLSDSDDEIAPRRLART